MLVLPLPQLPPCTSVQRFQRCPAWHLIHHAVHAVLCCGAQGAVPCLLGAHHPGALLGGGPHPCADRHHEVRGRGWCWCCAVLCCAVLCCAVLSSAAAWLGWAPWGAGDCGAPPSPVQLESLPTPPQTPGLIVGACRILVVAQGGGGHLLKQLFELHGIKKRMYNNTQLSIWANHSGRRD